MALQVWLPLNGNLENKNCIVSLTSLGFVDCSSNNHTITPSNAVVDTTNQCFSITQQSNGYIKIEPSSDLNIGTSDFTLDFWLYKSSWYSSENLFGIGRYTTSTGLHCDITANGNGSIAMYNNGGCFARSSSGTLTLNTWNHLAFVRCAGKLTVYLNGNAVSGLTNVDCNVSIDGSTYGMYIGNENGELSYGTVGLFKNIRLSNRVRWNSNFNVNNDGLENQGLADITVTNSGAVVDNNGKIGKCYKFTNTH